MDIKWWIHHKKFFIKKSAENNKRTSKSHMFPVFHVYQTVTAHVYKLAVSIICVAFFWFYALTIMLAGAHFDGRTPNGAGILVVNSNESQTELRGEKTILWTFLSFIFLVLTLSAVRLAKMTTFYVLLQLCIRSLWAVFHVTALEKGTSEQTGC